MDARRKDIGAVQSRSITFVDPFDSRQLLTRGLGRSEFAVCFGARVEAFVTLRRFDLAWVGI